MQPDETTDDGPVLEEHDQEVTAEEEPTDRPGREAAKYRRQLREVQAEAEQLRGQLDAMRRREAERLAVKPTGPSTMGLHDGRDLWAYGTDPAALVDDEGTVDPERVAAAVRTIGAERPHLLQRVPDFDGGARTGVPRGGRDWSGVIATA